jgi:hypothetical protein
MQGKHSCLPTTLRHLPQNRGMKYHRQAFSVLLEILFFIERQVMMCKDAL